MIPRNMKCADCIGKLATLDMTVDGFAAGTRVKITGYNHSFTVRAGEKLIAGLKKKALTLCDEEQIARQDMEARFTAHIEDLKTRLKEAQRSLQSWKCDCLIARKERDLARTEADTWRGRYARSFSADLLRPLGGV